MRLRLWLPVILAAAATVIFLSRNSESEASWVIRRVHDDGMRRCFFATAETSVRSCGRTVAGTMEIIHGTPDRCRMEYTSGPLKGVVIASDGNQMRTFDPASEIITVTPDEQCPGLTEKLDLLLANHRVTSSGIRTVAGRPAHVVLVRDNESRRVLKRLWVDAETYAVLGQEDHDYRGRVQSSTRFISVRFEEAIPDKVFELPRSRKTIAKHDKAGGEMKPQQLSEMLGFRVRFPAYVPKGYQFDSCRLHSCCYGCSHPLACIRYTNGLTSISVFESKANAECGCPDIRQESSVLSKCDRGNAARVTMAGISCVVIGDLPGTEITRITDSLR